jgi:hypothetical protein
VGKDPMLISRVLALEDLYAEENRKRISMEGI